MSDTDPHWRVVDCASVAGRAWNEDRADASGSLAWVMDGAGLAPAPRFHGEPTDAAWLVETASTWLASDAARGPTVRHVTTGLEKHVTRAFGVPCPEDPAGGPTSCLAVLRLDSVDPRRARVSWAICGDVVILLPEPYGDVRVVTDARVKPFEARSLAALRAADAESDKVPPAAQAQIRANRARVNRPGGFPLVCPGAPWAADMLAGEAELELDRPVVVLTDGLYRLVDVVGRYDDWSLYAACCKRGLPALVKELRTLEEEDASRRRYPRFKVHDDASGLILAAQ